MLVVCANTPHIPALPSANGATLKPWFAPVPPKDLAHVTLPSMSRLAINTACQDVIPVWVWVRLVPPKVKVSLPNQPVTKAVPSARAATDLG